MNQLALFDWNVLDSETRSFVQEKTQNIHARLKRTAEDIIVIGQDLIEVRDKLSTGGRGGVFLEWLHAEFEMTDRHARRFMAVAEKFKNKLDIMSTFPVTVLYELASPSMPETIVEMVETGQIPPTLPAIREAKQEIIQKEQSSGVLSGFGRTLVELEEEPTLPVIFPAQPEIEQHQQEEKLFIHRIEESITRVLHARFGEVIPESVNAIAEETLEDLRENYSPFIPPAQPKIDFHQWQKDNLALGLDRFGDIKEEEKEEEEESFEEIEECPLEAPEPVVSRGVPPALLASESNEWYTPASYVEAARELMGGIDIDPASCETANKIVQAGIYYDIHSNGLDKEWNGHVWLNPPYGMSEGRSNQDIWSQRLIQQYESGITTEAILLVNANTEARWFQPLYDYLICFTNHRIKFYNANGTPNQPTQGNALVYFGKQRQRFIELFRQFGRIEEEAKIDVSC